MKHEVVKVMGGARGFWVLVVVFALQAREQHVNKRDSFSDRDFATPSSIQQVHALNASVKESLAIKAYDAESHTTTSVDVRAGEYVDGSNDASLPVLFRGDLSPANAAYTITRSGVYKLTSAKTASGVPNIAITANNVTLDLGGNTLTGGTNGIEITGNNVTIKNGLITGMTSSGVLVQGTSCRVEGLDISTCATGVTLENCNQCVVEQCHVRNTTQAGISLLTSFTTYIHGCSVDSVESVADAYGFVASNGGNNTIHQCMVRDVQTTSAVGSNKIVGIALSEENQSQIQANTVQSIDSLTTVSAYGIWVNNGDYAYIVNNYLSNVTTSNNRGQGVLVNQMHSYVAKNVCYDCVISFSLVSPDYITSQANARGVYNIDASLTTPDTVPLLVDQALTVESKLDPIALEELTIESKLDYLTACDYQSLPAPTTLSTDYGAYCLSADMSGDLLIMGTGITLCLNGHTITGGTNGIVVSGDEAVIKNGTVRNATASGIKITGDKCLLEDITSIGNVTGFELDGADNTVLKSCTAFDNTREGFLLTNAQKNSFEACEALNTSGAGMVAAFKTTSGTGNRFINCKVNGVTSSDADAYGMLGLHESQTQMSDSSVMNVTGAAYTAGIGMLGDYLDTPTVNDFTYNEARYSTCTAWVNTPVGAYIALANFNSPYAARVLQFSPLDGLSSVTVTQNFLGDCSWCSWLVWNNKQYLAVAGDSNASNDIFIYEFSPAEGTLTTLGSYAYHATAGLNACDWLLSGTCAYAAYVGDYSAGTNPLGVLRFGGSGNPVKTTGLGTKTYAFAQWHTYQGKPRLAVRSSTDVEVYGFNDPQGSELLSTNTLCSYFTDANGKLMWFDVDGQTYMALSNEGFLNQPTVRVLRYSENPQATLELYATFTYAVSSDGGTYGIDALVTGTTVYIAVGGDIVGEATKILVFDPYQSSVSAGRLRQYYDCSDESDTTSDVRWNRCVGADDKVFLAAAKDTGTASAPCLRVFGFNLNNQSAFNVVNDATISGVPGGDGLLLDPVINSAYNNAAYNCHDGLQQALRTSYPVQQPFDTSNRAVPSK